MSAGVVAKIRNLLMPIEVCPEFTRVRGEVIVPSLRQICEVAQQKPEIYHGEVTFEEPKKPSHGWSPTLLWRNSPIIAFRPASPSDELVIVVSTMPEIRAIGHYSSARSGTQRIPIPELSAERVIQLCEWHLGCVSSRKKAALESIKAHDEYLRQQADQMAARSAEADRERDLALHDFNYFHGG